MQTMDITSEMANMLRPDQFDWAEDVEEEVMGDSSSEDTASDEEMDEMEETMASFYALERQPGSHGRDRAADMEELEEDEGETFQVKEDTGASPGPFIVNGAVGGPDEPDSVDNKIEDMQGDVDREFAFRRMCLEGHNDGEIHHFNWLGCPVNGYSATPPAISLLFLLATPKVPVQGDEWRMQSIMQRAMVFVDPVIVCLEESGWRELCLKGFDLVQWATGRTFKFYSPHGHWEQDAREMDARSAMDNGDIDQYVADNLAAGNGFTRRFSIRAREQWETERDECFHRVRKEHAARGKSRSKDHKPSPLRQSILPRDFEYEIEPESSEMEVERPVSRLSRKRRFEQSSSGGSDLSGGRKRLSIGNNEHKPEEKSERRLLVHDYVQLSRQERKQAKRLAKNKILTTMVKPSLDSIVEEDEISQDDQEDQNGQTGHHRRISSGTHTLNGPFGSETVLHDSNERPEKETNTRAIPSAPQTHSAPPDRKGKWRKNLRRISSKARKARNVLRFRDTQFSLAPKSSDSESSPALEPENGTDSSATPNETVPDENIIESSDSGFAEQYVSFPTPHFDAIPDKDKKPPEKTVFHRFSERATTTPQNKKRNSFLEGFKEACIVGFRAVGSYYFVMI